MVPRVCLDDDFGNNQSFLVIKNLFFVPICSNMQIETRFRKPVFKFSFLLYGLQIEINKVVILRYNNLSWDDDNNIFFFEFSVFVMCEL